MMRHFLQTLLVVTVLFTGTSWANDLNAGRFTLTDWDGPPLNVYFVEPVELSADAPVVIVMHGVRRNADEYAENWIDLVATYGFRVYAPEFSRKDFPGAERYNLGGIGTNKTNAYSALEPLYQAINARTAANNGYYLFGHSAGAQFVHRAVLFEPLENLQLAFVANAGWYTLPDLSIKWPYGLKGTPADEDSIKKWLTKPILVLLGDQDIDPNDPNLRQTKEARAQGPNRFVRGQFFFYSALAAAERLNIPLAWRMGTVPDVAHDNAGMAQAAASLIMADQNNKDARAP